MKKVKLLQDIRLYEDDTLSVYMKEGTVCDVLLEYTSPDYIEGEAVVIFDGREALSVGKEIVQEVKEVSPE
jgi:hypothetical protein